VLYLLEFIAVAYFAFVGWRLLRQPFARHLLTVGAVLAGLATAAVLFRALSALFLTVQDNIVLALLVAILASVTAYFVVLHLLQRRFRRDDHALARSLERRLALPRWLDRTFRAGLLGLVLAAALFVADFLVALAGLTPMREDIERGTVVLRFLLPPAGEGVAPDFDPLGEERPLEDAMEEQSRFLVRFGRGLRDMRRAIAEKTGTKRILDQVAALRELIDLPLAEQQWLTETTPGLRRLLNHPTILAIMHNDPLLDLVEEVSHGSMAAVYRIGEDPSVRKLLEDAEVRAALREVDLASIRARIHERRRRLRRLLPAAWQTTVLRSTTDFEAALADPGRWRPHEAGDTALLWTPRARLALARSRFRIETAGKLQVECRGEGRVTLGLNGRLLEASVAEGATRAAAEAAAGEAQVVLLIDFRGTDPPRRCLVQVFRP